MKLVRHQAGGLPARRARPGKAEIGKVRFSRRAVRRDPSGHASARIAFAGFRHFGQEAGAVGPPACQRAARERGKAEIGDALLAHAGQLLGVGNR